MRLIDADVLVMEICRDQCERKYEDCDGMCEMVAYAKNMPTVGGWISVKDRLPENEQYVILWTKTDVMMYAKYLDDEPHRPWITYDENGSIRAWDNVVTHWMPLPTPPEEVSVDA